MKSNKKRQLLRSKAAAQIARELLSAERGDRVQNPVVRPAVVSVEELNVIFTHGGGGSLTLSSGEFYLAQVLGKAGDVGISGALAIDGQLSRAAGPS